ncbi:hypothetical protein SETIT_1G298200v2 [Setaria italica]|uniref:Uncharacterized protein n=1 Tax=Setaria italica TaxID=4555 RepID=A0A368PQL6_SETIT|nr:hypothetical protein SETIT_1G298200v2 [Setaria italica]
MERWPARAASASCRWLSRCWWPHTGVWCGHEPRQLSHRQLRQHGQRRCGRRTHGQLRCAMASFCRCSCSSSKVGKDVEGDCRHAPGMKRTADEVTLLLISLAAATAGYGSD